MPRSAKLDDKRDGAVLSDATPVKTNGINEAQLKQFVAEIEDEQAKIDEIMRNAQVACQPHLDQIKAIKKEAAENGIPKKPLSAKMRERSLKRRAEAVSDSLSEEQKEIFLEISMKLGDLPLFQAAAGDKKPFQ